MKNNNIDITQDFDNKLYYPKCALVLYESQGLDPDVYVEHFDMDGNGNPINAHPLTVMEADILAKTLMLEHEKESAFLKPKSVLPSNVLSLDPNTEKGTVIWHTKAQQRELFFVESLGIPNGKAYVPPMLWKASKSSLTVFALKNNRRPTLKSQLYHCPFFNIYADGKVCLGTIKIDIKNTTSVEDFMKAWEHYFFHSYFSHALVTGGQSKENSVTLWKRLIKQGTIFPIEVLMPHKLTLKNILL
ncbi:PRTRC system protein B [Chryseobacterium lactis]|uniref:PRTRC system protein B n=3 Tax=Chryseobacterium TaxID=59732 RepID=A0A3G6RL22_CHRLC|nr:MULTISPECIES: PRTRC system protein B [Bacteroidota]AZA84580.1 PRTRC system protein B [Chryseobacterium lactis]AZB04968.1 PRTRC system protein B [Chryseobacterium lactis]KMQ64443.1 PRTRC system protein B [Chryseobacterium angstadtii]MBF6643613.1 PRTRC system protein B [Chryseobacterium indologenes]PNW14699.1 PRTRC system protein B [Chryseobacterium lactis]